MSELFQKRLQKNLQQNIKYLTLVFNDFFVLALIFLLGGFLFWYAQILRQIPDNQWYYQPLLALILFIPLTVGKLATLFKSADSQFIWTNDDAIAPYMRRARNYSMVVPTIIILLVTGLAFPFATVKAGVSLPGFLMLLLGLILAKYNHLTLLSTNFFENNQQGLSNWLVALDLVGVVAGIYLPGVSLAVELGEWLFIRLTRGWSGLFDWTKAIEYEQRRMEVVQGFYSLFTDIPERPIKIKRRKYLDFVLTKIEHKPTPDFYLFQRTLLRNPEFLNLVVRMTVFALLIAFMVQDIRFVVGLNFLIVFLTLYQLLPLYSHFERNSMYRSLPINPKGKQKAFQRVIGGVILAQTLVIALWWLIVLPNKLPVLLGVIVLVALNILSLVVDLPARTKKLASQSVYRAPIKNKRKN